MQIPPNHSGFWPHFSHTGSALSQSNRLSCSRLKLLIYQRSHPSFQVALRVTERRAVRPTETAPNPPKRVGRRQGKARFRPFGERQIATDALHHIPFLNALLPALGWFGW